LRGFRDRRRADAFQQALERYERMVGTGTDADEARRTVGPELGDLGRIFSLATSVGRAHAAAEPDPAFARRVAMQLRSAQVVRKPALRKRGPRFSLAPLAYAAAVLAAAVVMIPSLRSLPGDPLYAVKGAAEDARVWLATGQTEARVRLALADERFEEVEGLIDRSRVVVLGPGVHAAAAADIDDAELRALIEQALADAGEQLERAAQILTESPAPKEDIDNLVQVTQRGKTLATDIAEELPQTQQPPVLRAVVRLSKIEAKAKAAQTQAIIDATPPPCDTPTPSPSPTPTPAPTLEGEPTASPATASATPTAAAESPSPEPTEEPEPTPCVSPSPSPTPTPTPTPTQSPDESPDPSPTPTPAEGNRSVESPEDGQEEDDVAGEDDHERGRGLTPFGEFA
jgi:hypothetical protein